MRRILKALGLSRLAILVWAWRRRAEIRDWIRFALSAPGRPWSDVRSEFRLRLRLRRLPAQVSVNDGVVTIEGRLTPADHQTAREAVASIQGITGINDRVVPAREAPKVGRLRTA